MVVVIGACRSARFAELLAAAIDDRQGPRRVLVLGTSPRGSATLGRFTGALDDALRWTFGNDTEIGCSALCDELVRTIPDGSRRALNFGLDTVLRRRVPVLAGYTGPLDIRDALRGVLADDERRHFVPKAQGGELSTDGQELGELAWYFTGRSRERTAIVGWLTGPPAACSW